MKAIILHLDWVGSGLHKPPKQFNGTGNTYMDPPESTCTTV